MKRILFDLINKGLQTIGGFEFMVFLPFAGGPHPIQLPLEGAGIIFQPGDRAVCPLMAVQEAGPAFHYSDLESPDLKKDLDLASHMIGNSFLAKSSDNLFYSMPLNIIERHSGFLS